MPRPYAGKPEPRIDHQPIEILSYISALVGPRTTLDTTILPPLMPGVTGGVVDATWMWYLNLILDVEEQFSVKITDADLRYIDTVGDLVRIVRAKCA